MQTPEQEKNSFRIADQLGNLLIVTAAGMLVALALIVAVSQDDGEVDPRDKERHFVEEYEEDDREWPPRTDRVPDYSDAEERFAPDCDHDLRRDGRGLFDD